MPEYRHPRGATVAIDLGGERVVCDEDGVFEADGDATVRAFAQAHGTTPAALRLNQHDEATDAEVLVNDGVCPWCDEYDGDHVGQHASSAHPEAWDDYKAEA